LQAVRDSLALGQARHQPIAQPGGVGVETIEVGDGPAARYRGPEYRSNTVATAATRAMLRNNAVYNVLGIHEFATAATKPIPAGHHQVRVEFAYDGGGLAKGGDVTLYYDAALRSAPAGSARPSR
jgi:hypothetical protein